MRGQRLATIAVHIKQRPASKAVEKELVSEVYRLRGIIGTAIEISKYGSQGDAIQRMLKLLRTFRPDGPH